MTAAENTDRIGQRLPEYHISSFYAWEFIRCRHSRYCLTEKALPNDDSDFTLPGRGEESDSAYFGIPANSTYENNEVGEENPNQRAESSSYPQLYLR